MAVIKLLSVINITSRVKYGKPKGPFRQTAPRRIDGEIGADRSLKLCRTAMHRCNVAAHQPAREKTISNSSRVCLDEGEAASAPGNSSRVHNYPAFNYPTKSGVNAGVSRPETRGIARRFLLQSVSRIQDNYLKILCTFFFLLFPE